MLSSAPPRPAAAPDDPGPSRSAASAILLRAAMCVVATVRCGVVSGRGDVRLTTCFTALFSQKEMCAAQKQVTSYSRAQLSDDDPSFRIGGSPALTASIVATMRCDECR